jgi:phosphatidylglycerophosphate synthase
MLDAPVRRMLAPVLDRIGAALARAKVRPGALTGVGFAAGLAACLCAGASLWPAALALWLVNRVCDGLDGPVARHRGATDLGGFLDITADFAVYAGFVLAVAIAEPSARLACTALLVGYYVSGSAFLALSSLLERRRHPGRWLADGRSLRFVGGLAEGTETVIVYCLFCVFPGHSALIAWSFTAAVTITAGYRIRLAAVLLRVRTNASDNAAPVGHDLARAVTS